MGIEFDVFLDGEVNEEYQIWLPEGYAEPKNFPFTTKEHETLFNDIVDWLDMQLRKLFPHILI